MMAQLLGGMEGTVGMSSLTGRLVLDKSILVQGSELPIVRIMPLYSLFPSISPYLCKTSCPKHNVKLHNYALTITTTMWHVLMVKIPCIGYNL